MGLKRRPKAPKNYKLDGDDYNTRTKYAGAEHCLGDSLKVILLQVYDILEYEGLQKYEIQSLLNALVDEHVYEVEQ